MKTKKNITVILFTCLLSIATTSTCFGDKVTDIFTDDEGSGETWIYTEDEKGTQWVWKYDKNGNLVEGWEIDYSGNPNPADGSAERLHLLTR